MGEVVGRLAFGSSGLGSIPCTVVFTYHGTSATRKLKSLRSALWQRLSSLSDVVNSASCRQGEAIEQRRIRGSAADINTAEQEQIYLSTRIVTFRFAVNIRKSTYFKASSDGSPKNRILVRTANNDGSIR